MKTLLHTAVISLSLCLLATTSANAAHQLQSIDCRITPLGDGDITLSITFDAPAWQVWKHSVGENPALMKREIERMFSKMVLSDYRLERNDLERKVSFHMHAVGVCRYLGNNAWETDLDDGTAINATRRKLNDNDFFVTSTLSDGFMTANQEMTISTPDGASKLEQAKSETGTPVLRYHFKPNGQTAMSLGKVGAGSVIALAGLACLLLTLLTGNKGRPVTTPSNVTQLEEPPALETVSA